MVVPLDIAWASASNPPRHAQGLRPRGVSLALGLALRRGAVPPLRLAPKSWG